jgi:hypothetical protein
MAGKRGMLRAGWCAWSDMPCAKTCPVPSVDNFGQPYPGCARVRLKSMAEIDAMCAATEPGETKQGA